MWVEEITGRDQQIDKIKKQPMECEKIFVNSVSNKGSIFKNFKELMQPVATIITGTEMICCNMTMEGERRGRLN